MIPHIEKEYKMMITKEDYDFYLHHLSLTTIRQTNYYYVTSKQNCAVRIRKIDSRYYFTLKIKEKDYHQEYEFEIKENNLSDSLIQDLFNQFHIDDFHYIGEMETVRSTKEYEYGELCIDQSTYLQTTDYEMEFELKDYQKDNAQEFYDLLQQRNLIYQKSPFSKFKRFLIQKASK